MLRYRAVVYFMDSDKEYLTLGNYQSQIEARHFCYRHAGRELHFQLYHPGLWKAQGTYYWYQIRQIQASRPISDSPTVQST